MGARLDLPLADTVAGRMLAWLVGGLVYAAVVALAIFVMADRAWFSLHERPQLATVTLQSADDGDIETALAILLRDPAVLDAIPLGDAELRSLMTPWLGRTEPGELPWPALIDVRLDPRAAPDMAALEQALDGALDGASLTVEARSAERIGPTVALVRSWSGALLALVLPAGLLAIATVTGLAIRLCRNAVELLWQMGASPGYQVDQLEGHALAGGLRGGAIGFGLALLTVIALLHSVGRIAPADAIEIGLRPLDWGLLAGLAATAVLLAVAVVRGTAYLQLQKRR